jgi:hypothetical protein
MKLQTDSFGLSKKDMGYQRNALSKKEAGYQERNGSSKKEMN